MTGSYIYGVAMYMRCGDLYVGGDGSLLRRDFRSTRNPRGSGTAPCCAY